MPSQRATEHPGVCVNHSHQLKKIGVKEIDHRLEIRGIAFGKQAAPRERFHDSQSRFVRRPGQERFFRI